MHENREISSTPWSDDQGRSAKATSRTADMYVPEKSDCAVVPVNQPNKGGQPSAEAGEGRAQTRENIAQSHMHPTQSGKRMSQGLDGVRKTAKEPKIACESLATSVRRTFSHLERTEKRLAKAERIGTNVFIGHGRSKEWKDLKDFISERMRLPWDEFNRVPVAGIPNTVRLSTMLDAAAIAFLILTAEDEMADGKMQARMNVVHEAGLFQGRLGFSRAIILLEEGCEEFSNIEGLRCVNSSV